MKANRVVETRNLEQYKKLHKQKVYGTTIPNRKKIVLPHFSSSRAKHILDYGSGGTDTTLELARQVGAKGYLFEPGRSELSEIPQEFLDSPFSERLVLCSHVLEHVDEDEVDEILKHLKELSSKVLILVPTTVGKQVLPNGEEAHTTVKPKDWWIEKFEEHFPTVKSVRSIRKSELTVTTWESTKGRTRPKPTRGVVNPRTRRRRRKKATPPPRANSRASRTTKRVPAEHLKDLNGKSVAIVGRAKSLEGSGEGPKIDSYDVVIRVNQKLPLDPTKAKDIGTRTDLVYTCRGCKSVRVAANKEDVPALAYDKEFRKSVSSEDGFTPFTGTVAIIQAFAWGAKEVYATGMDLYVGPATTKRGGNLQLNKSNSYAFHDPNRDAELLRDLWAERNGTFVPGQALKKALEAEKPLQHYRGKTPPKVAPASKNK